TTAGLVSPKGGLVVGPFHGTELYANESVVSLGATVDGLHGLFGSARLRSFGPRPLIESGSVRSKATGLVNVEAGYKIGKGVRVALDVFNLLDAQASDIDYYY